MNTRRLIRQLCSLSITVSIAGLAGVPVIHAQDDVTTNNSPTVGIIVSPPTFELTGNPGDVISNTVRLENLHDYTVKLAVDRRNFTAVGEEGAIDLTEGSTSYSLASWLTVEPKEDELPPHSTRVYRFTINTPLTAEPGGHFGSLVFRTIPTTKPDGSGATVSQEIASIILLRVAGTTTEDASISSFQADKIFQEYGPVTLDTRVANDGNVHLKPTGTVSITNMFGRKVANLELDSKNVLPGAVRRLDSTWNTKWGFGRYTATVVMVYGKDQLTRAAVTNFYILPYKVVGIFLLIFLILITLMLRSRKRLGRAFKILFTGKG